MHRFLRSGERDQRAVERSRPEAQLAARRDSFADPVEERHRGETAEAVDGRFALVRRGTRMKILITGAGGQLGRALQTVLTEHEVIALTHAQLDITRFEDTREAVGKHCPEVVINAAAYNNVDRAESDHTGAYKLNSVAPRNLAIVTADRGGALLHVSTDYVFDGMGLRPYHEFDLTNPL